MKQNLIRGLIIILIHLSQNFSFCQTRKNDNNKKLVEIVTSDIDNFWTAFNSTKSPDDTSYFYNYFKNGSAGLKDFANRGLFRRPNVGKGNVQEMTNAAFKYKEFYKSIEKNTKNISALSDSINWYCIKLQQLYKMETFPKVYFIIGQFGAAGIASENGLILSAEILSTDSITDLDEVEALIKKYLKTKEDIPPITIHELIHFLQPDKDSVKTILDNAIIEGGADFITKLTVGRVTNRDQHAFGDQHEKELWSELEKDLDSTNMSLWFYDYFKGKHSVPDLGYFMGYKICESYYENAADKSKAIRDIVEVKNSKEFLKLSDYGKKFAAK
jgi:hypothetical protein